MELVEKEIKDLIDRHREISERCREHLAALSADFKTLRALETRLPLLKNGREFSLSLQKKEKEEKEKGKRREAAKKNKKKKRVRMLQVYSGRGEERLRPSVGPSEDRSGAVGRRTTAELVGEEWTAAANVLGVQITQVPSALAIRKRARE